ncbi:MAG TPA: metallopeptidase TldD-related protein, partial [Candidatus Acidoferrales bacterium]|nr:metallopeptidase TldD-related protein [Candidatus Acidoferrales bacterium]
MRPDEQEGALLDACKRALRVIDTSIYQGEVFTSYTSTISAELEKGKIKSSQSGYEGGVGVRVYKSGSMGYAHASLERVEFAVERAISAARAGNPDKDFRSLALPENYPTVNGTWDRKVASLDADAVVQLTTDVADACRIDERIDIVNSGASVGRWSDAVANTLGVAGAESGTQASLDVDVVAHIGDATGNGFEYAASRRFDFDLDAIGRAAGEMALASVNPKPIRSGKMPVVIDPLAVGPIIAAAVTVSAEDAQRDRSFLAGRTGDRVAVSAFTIVD